MKEYTPQWQHLAPNAYLIAKPNPEYRAISGIYEIYSDGTIVCNGEEIRVNKLKLIDLIEDKGEIGEKYHFGWGEDPYLSKDSCGAVVFLGWGEISKNKQEDDILLCS